MLHGIRTATARIMHPITRPLHPIYMYTGEVPPSVKGTVAIARTDAYLGIRFHPGSPTPLVVSDIAASIEKGEAPGWLGPFGHEGPIDLAAIRADPVGTLGSLACIPAFACNIPEPLQAPWMYN